MKTRMTSSGQLQASFRDPSGFVFDHEGTLYRQVNRSYQDDYDLLMRSGLYDRLVKSKKLIPHQEADPPFSPAPEVYLFLRPERVDFISYPYEWCFSQLKDAALLTLSIQKTALEYGLSLKDASAYNIQYSPLHTRGLRTGLFTYVFAAGDRPHPGLAAGYVPNGKAPQFGKGIINEIIG